MHCHSVACTAFILSFTRAPLLGWASPRFFMDFACEIDGIGKRKGKNRADGYRQPYFLSVIHLLSTPISFIFFCLPE